MLPSCVRINVNPPTTDAPAFDKSAMSSHAHSSAPLQRQLVKPDALDAEGCKEAFDRHRGLSSRSCFPPRPAIENEQGSEGAAQRRPTLTTSDGLEGRGAWI